MGPMHGLNHPSTYPDEDKRRIARLAIGRLLRMMVRPSRPGDVAEYDRLRGLILDVSPEPGTDTAPNWVRDRLRGAAGD